MTASRAALRDFLHLSLEGWTLSIAVFAVTFTVTVLILKEIIQ